MKLHNGLLALGLMCMLAGPVYASDDAACNTAFFNPKRVVYRCEMTAKDPAQQLQFKARFSGSHDDTELSIALTLDGLPVNCAQGSKTQLNGEDGDVSLDCLFVVDGKSGSQRILGVTVNIYHARLTTVSLTAP